MLPIGEPAPDFTLPDDQSQPRTLAELRAEGPLILYFYPADFTPGCTREACDLRDLHADIVRSGLRVVGISPQDPATHARFRERYELPFTLLSDVDKAVIKRYQVNGPLGIGVRRATYRIDRDGIIRDALLADFAIARHTEFVRRQLTTAADQ